MRWVLVYEDRFLFILKLKNSRGLNVSMLEHHAWLRHTLATIGDNGMADNGGQVTSEHQQQTSLFYPNHLKLCHLYALGRF